MREFGKIGNVLEEQDKRVTINIHHGCETESRHYAHVDCSGRSQADG